VDGFAVRASSQLLRRRDAYVIRTRGRGTRLSWPGPPYGPPAFFVDRL